MYVKYLTDERGHTLCVGLRLLALQVEGSVGVGLVGFGGGLAFFGFLAFGGALTLSAGVVALDPEELAVRLDCLVLVTGMVYNQQVSSLWWFQASSTELRDAIMTATVAWEAFKELQALGISNSRSPPWLSL